MTDQQLIKPMTNIIRLVSIVVFILICFRLEAKPTKLVFTCWGSPFEWKAVEKVNQKKQPTTFQHPSTFPTYSEFKLYSQVSNYGGC